MWGRGIVGYGRYPMTYASGRELDWFYCGFSPCKQNLTLYIMAGFDRYEQLLKELGKHKSGKSCLYLKRLADVDVTVLDEIITRSVDVMKRKYGK